MPVQLQIAITTVADDNAYFRKQRCLKLARERYDTLQGLNV